MKAFHFKLAAVLKLRRNQRDHQRQLMADALRKDEDLQTQRRQIEANRTAQLEEMRELAGEGHVDVDATLKRRNFAGQLIGDISLIERQRTLLGQQVQFLRAALVRADQNVRALEKLEEKQRTEFVFEQDRREAREVEESWQALHLGDFRR